MPVRSRSYPVALLLLVLLGSACSRDPLRITEGAARGYNVVLVTLDTTRPDYLGAYGAEAAGTLAFDGVARSGVRFDRAFANTPLTLPSHCSLFTGLVPPRHGVRNNGTYALPPEMTTLAELLGDEGWDTAAFVSCFVLDERFGLDQGFDEYEFAATSSGAIGPQSLEHERTADHVTASAIRWLEQRHRERRESPLFLWVHYFDAHAPYAPPPTRAHPRVPESREDAYAAEIAYADLYLGELLRAVGKYTEPGRTLFVVASDHGEALGEHGEDEHGVFLYDATMRVALAFSAPGVLPEGLAADDRIVALTDVAPSVLHLLGIAAPPGLDGANVFARPDPARAVYLESVFPAENMGCAPLFGFRRLEDQAIWAPRPEYYELALDPAAQSNEWDRMPPAAEAELDRIRAIAAGEAAAGDRELTQEERERLETLGYVRLATTGSDPDRDPKDQIGQFAGLRKALDLRREGRYEEALALAQEVGAGLGAVDVAVMLVAELQDICGRPEEAIATLEDLVRERESPEAMTALARLHFARGDMIRMEELLLRIEAIDPLRGSVPLLRGDRLRAAGDVDAARREYERAIRVDGIRAGPMARARLADL